MPFESRDSDRSDLRAVAWRPRGVTVRTCLVAGFGALGTSLLGSVVMILLNGSFWQAVPYITAIAGVAILSVTGVIWALREMLAPMDELERALKFYRENGLDETRPDEDDRGDLVYLVDGLVSDARAEIHQVRNAADTDPLTGLLNRRGFDRCRGKGTSGSIIFLDIDDFKTVNDALGHDVGDLVLSATADLLRSVLRQGELVARFGGEEFVVFLPGMDLETAEQIAERIRASAEFTLSTELGRVTLSAGVAEQTAGQSFAEALNRADDALYTAKRSGRNRVRVYDPASTTMHSRYSATAAE